MATIKQRSLRKVKLLNKRRKYWRVRKVIRNFSIRLKREFSLNAFNEDLYSKMIADMVNFEEKETQRMIAALDRL
jgi:hypothetical protein